MAIPPAKRGVMPDEAKARLLTWADKVDAESATPGAVVGKVLVGAGVGVLAARMLLGRKRRAEGGGSILSGVVRTAAWLVPLAIRYAATHRSVQPGKSASRNGSTMFP
ncbi:hypothetical protein PHYC_02672 [Phycisphaerales bacterium]|nr:hypothetical protein PHYC_02672 [Phycisphaerales bacterium]